MFKKGSTYYRAGGIEMKFIQLIVIICLLTLLIINMGCQDKQKTKCKTVEICDCSITRPLAGGGGMETVKACCHKEERCE